MTSKARYVDDGIASVSQSDIPSGAKPKSRMSLKSFIKGWVGETVGAVAQKLLLDPKIYVSLNNITLQSSNGTTQIFPQAQNLKAGCP